MTTETLVGGTLHTYGQNTWASSDIVAGADGKFYASYIADGTHITVKQWDGAQWQEYASFTAAQSGAAGISDDVDLVIDAQGHLHVAFRSYSGSGLTSDRGVSYGEFSGGSWSFSKIQSSGHSYGWMNYDDPTLALDARARRERQCPRGLPVRQRRDPRQLHPLRNQRVGKLGGGEPGADERQHR